VGLVAEGRRVITLRYAWRSLSRAPGFASLVIVTIAIGVGSVTAVFSLVDAVLLRPLRFDGADRAHGLWTARAAGSTAQPGVSDVAFERVRTQLADVATTEGYQFGIATITGGAEPVVVSVPAVTPGLLSLVGASPLVGRLFNEHDVSSGSRSVLISEEIWTSQFGRDPGVLDRRIALDGEAHIVVGVLSQRVRYPEASVGVWKPLDVSRVGATRRRIQGLVVRRAGASAEEMRARLEALTLSLRTEAALAPTESLLLGDVAQVRISRNSARPLWLMFGAVALVLLIACVNATNLLLVRASSRRGEFAVLRAIGAARAAILRHVASEVVLLTGAGALAGIALAALLIRGVRAVLPAPMSFLTSTVADLNWQVMAFASVISVLVLLLAGLAPAWRSSRVDAIETLKSQSRSIAGPSDERWQAAMLALQIGCVVVLLAGTGLLLRSFTRLTNVDPGFDADALVEVAVELTSSRYAANGVALATMQQLAEGIETSGIGVAAFAGGTAVSFEIRPEAEGGRSVDATGMVLPWRRVSPNYFETLGIVVLQGQTFAAEDESGVMMVNDRLARQFWGEQSPVGRRFRIDSDEPWRTVVGVVSDVRMMGLDDPTGHGMEFYVPYSRTQARGGFSVIVRSALAAGVVIARVKEVLWTIDPGAPISDAGNMRDRLLDSLYRQQFLARLSGAFAAIAVLLAGIGVYGVTAYWINRRRRDLAIRIALGATRGQIVSTVLARAAGVTIVGCALGAVGSAFSLRALRTMLYETSGAEPVVLLATALLMALLVITACAGPVRAAISVKPADLLRDE
jgi:putative ABC transport system permease protein